MMKFCNILVLAGRKWQSQSGYSHGNKEEPGNVMFRVIQLCCVISYSFINFIFLSKNVLHLVIQYTVKCIELQLYIKINVCNVIL